MTSRCKRSITRGIPFSKIIAKSNNYSYRIACLEPATMCRTYSFGICSIDVRVHEMMTSMMHICILRLHFSCADTHSSSYHGWCAEGARI